MENKSVPIVVPAAGLPSLPVGFWLAIAAGLALRVWYFSDLVAQPWFGYPLVDALTFDRTALGILDGQPQGVYSRPPLYPYFLAVLYRFFGHSAAAVVWVQFALGLAVLAPAYRLGEVCFGPRAALAGTWIAAWYPLRIYFEGETLDVTLFTLLFLGALWSLWRSLEQGDAARALLAGLIYGAAALTRPNALVALPFVALGAALARHRVRPALAACWLLGVVLALAPSTAHNWRAGRVLVPVAANGGVNFFLGNERGATGLTPVPPGLRWEQTMLRPLRAGRPSLAEQDRWWYARAAEEISAAPGRWLRLLGVKAALLLNAAESSNNKALGHFTAVSLPVRHYHLWFGVMVCLAMPGLATGVRGGVTFLRWVVLGFGASIVLFFVSARYRLPLVPLLAPAAAAGAGAVLRALRGRETARAAGLAAIAVAAGVAVFPDWFGAGSERISADFQVAQVRLMRDEPRLALAALERARLRDPGDPDVLNSLGAALVGLGDLDAAAAAYRAALELGDYSEVWFNLGIVAERRGADSREEAAACYRRAAALNPADPRPRVNLAALEAGGAAGPAPGQQRP